MAVHAYLASAWRKAKCVWWWDAAAWQKAKVVSWWNGSSWVEVFRAPDMTNDLVGATDSAANPANIVFTWTPIGQQYGATIELFQNGIGFGAVDAEANLGTITLNAVDPTATWTAEVRDGNGDLARTRTATITGP